MISSPAVIYMAVCGVHIAQQMARNKALRIRDGPEADFIVQAMVMAVIVEMLHQSNLSVVSWGLTLPAVIVSGILVFWMVMTHCSL